jgi:hypothetical protein
MRILIYSETDAAKERLAELRAEGYRASLRNPYLFNPDQFDKACDRVIADDQKIIAAYASAGIPVEKLTWEETEGDSESIPEKGDSEEGSESERSSDDSKEISEPNSSADDAESIVESEDPTSDLPAKPKPKPKPKSTKKKSGEAAN